MLQTAYFLNELLAIVDTSRIILLQFLHFLHHCPILFFQLVFSLLSCFYLPFELLYNAFTFLEVALKVGDVRLGLVGDKLLLGIGLGALGGLELGFDGLGGK